MKFTTRFLIIGMLLTTALFANEDIAKVETDQAPAAIGPYSQAVVAGDYLFVSGQLPIDPETGEFLWGPIEEQTDLVLDNIEAILEAAGATFDDVVKVEIFLKDMRDFKAMNAIYAERFSGEVKPARQTIQAAKLPMDSLIEISCIALAPLEDDYE